MTRFRQNALSAEELLALDGHLKECLECRERAAQNDLSTSVCSALIGVARPMHLTYEELEGLADGSLAGMVRERVASHASSCADCRAEIASFRALAAEAKPGVTAAAPAFFGRVRSAFARPLLSVAATAVLLLAIGGAIWVKTRDRSRELANDPAAKNAVAENNNIGAANETAAIPDESAEDHLADSTGKPAELEVALIDGGRTIGLDAAGNLIGLDALPPKYRSLLKDSLRDQKLPAADVGDLRSRPAATMGTVETSETFRVFGPVGRVVDTAAPTLRWQLVGGTEAYVAEVYDEKYNKVASSGRIADNWWTPHLQRGRTYVWQVTALKHGKEIKAPQRPAPEARFRVLDANRAAEIAALKRGSKRSHLLLALAYSEAGLFEDAGREMQKVVGANPRSPLARKFLEQIKAHTAGK